MKSRKLGVAALSAGLGTSAIVGGLAYAIRGRSSQVFGPSVYKGAPGRRSIALTFDDGPSPDSLRLLEILARENVPATFFQCGLNVLRHSGIARELYAEGHEIGNHTYSHPRLCPRIGWQINWQSPRSIFWQFARTQQILRTEVGAETSILRAPYGFRWFGMDEMQRRLGLLGVMWTVIGRDWELPAHAITSLVLKKSSPGGIVCLHDGRDIRAHPDISQTLQAVRNIIPALKDQGYRFETVSSILQATNQLG